MEGFIEYLFYPPEGGRVRKLLSYAHIRIPTEREFPIKAYYSELCAAINKSIKEGKIFFDEFRSLFSHLFHEDANLSLDIYQATTSKKIYCLIILFMTFGGNNL